MGRVYRVPYNGTYTNAGGNTDLCVIKPADDKPCRLLGFRMSQTSEIGDAQEENIRITIQHFAATVSDGSGGSAVTPVKNAPGVDVAAGFTARCNDTTVATTSGTATIAEEIGWNERNTPCEFWWPDEKSQIAFLQGEALVIRGETTPADDFTLCLTVFVEELP